MIRLPTPPQAYDQRWANQLCSAIERELRDSATSGQASTFGDVTVTGNLGVAGKSIFTGDATFGNATVANTFIAGNFTLAASALTLPTPTVTINAVANNTNAFRQIAAVTAAGAAWLSPAPGNAPGTPGFAAISMPYLPDWVPQGAPDSTVTTVANSVVANSPLGVSLAIAANSLTVGDCLRMTCRGVYGSALAAPNITLAVLNGAPGVMCTTGANAVGAASLVNRGWEVTVDFIVTALGAIAGRLEAQGKAILSTSATAAQIVDMENTLTIAFNTTVANSLQLCVTWGTAAAANTISCRETIWEVMKQ